MSDFSEISGNTEKSAPKLTPSETTRPAYSEPRFTLLKFVGYRLRPMITWFIIYTSLVLFAAILFGGINAYYNFKYLAEGLSDYDSEPVASAGAGIVGYLSMMFVVFVTECQFTDKHITSYMPYNSPLWDMVPIGRAKSMAAKIITGYVSVIYAYIIIYICLIFIIRIENTFVINILNSPLEMIRDFFTAPFIPIPQIEFLYNPFAEYDYGKDLAGQIATLIGVFPLFFMATTCLGLDIYYALCCRFSKNNTAAIISLAIQLALIVFVGWAFYQIDVNHQSIIKHFIYDSMPEEFVPVAIFAAIGEVKTFVGILITASFICLAVHYPMSKRFYNNLA